jgi:hypothetical protein
MGSPSFPIGWMVLRQENYGHALYLSTHRKHGVNMQRSTASTVLWRIFVDTSQFVPMLVEGSVGCQAGTFQRQACGCIVDLTNFLVVSQWTEISFR